MCKKNQKERERVQQSLFLQIRALIMKHGDKIGIVSMEWRLFKDDSFTFSFRITLFPHSCPGLSQSAHAAESELSLPPNGVDEEERETMDVE